MKCHKTSGNKAASNNAKTSSPFEKQNPSHGNLSELAQPHGPFPCHGNDPAANAAMPHAGKHQLQFTYVTSPVIPIEPLVTKKTLCEHYQMALRTLDYAIALGLPVVPVGRNIRFKFSQVQPWFEKNGYRRF